MTCGHKVGRGPSSSPNRDEIVYLSKKKYIGSLLSPELVPIVLKGMSRLKVQLLPSYRASPSKAHAFPKRCPLKFLIIY